MKLVSILLAVLIPLVLVYLLLKTQWSSGEKEVATPQAQIDVTGIRSDLLSIAQAERLYLASHGSYATLDLLQQDGTLTLFSGTAHRGYRFTAEVDDGAHFKVTATPSDPAKTGWPAFSINESLEISRE
jgi:hypothetical protein